MKTTFENEALQELVKIAKENGYRVFAFQKDKPISQVLIVSESGKIGSASASWGGLSYSTTHKPCREFGTGFGLSGVNGCELPSIERIRDCTETIKPHWAGIGQVVKYRDWEEYKAYRMNAILEYFEI